jgi:hypothetical protein
VPRVVRAFGENIPPKELQWYVSEVWCCEMVRDAIWIWVSLLSGEYHRPAIHKNVTDISRLSDNSQYAPISTSRQLVISAG